MAKQKAARSSAKTQMVRIDAELWERVGAEGVKRGLTARQEIEQRLRDSLSDSEVSEDGTGFKRYPWPHAVGRLVEALARDVAAGSQSADEALAALKIAIAGLLDTLLEGFSEVVETKGGVEAAERDHDGWASEGRWLAEQVRQAHLEQSMRLRSAADLWAHAAEKESARLTAGQRRSELLSIQKALLLAPENLDSMRSSERRAANPGRRSSG